MPSSDPAAVRPAASLPDEVVTCLQNARFVSAATTDRGMLDPGHAN
jgi:hypothetical protein